MRAFIGGMVTMVMMMMIIIIIEYIKYNFTIDSFVRLMGHAEKEEKRFIDYLAIFVCY